MTLLLSRPRTQQIDDDATRRQFLWMIGAAGLAGCAGSDDPSARPTATPDATLEFAYLDIRTTIPANPQRVIVLEPRGDLEFALIVGYPVIAIQTLDGDPIADHLTPLITAEPVRLRSAFGAMDYEEIAALRPDLIVQRANAFRGDFYGNARLAEIAPVLPVEADRTTWRDDLVAQSALVRRSVEAEELVAGYERAKAEVLADLGNVNALGRVAMLAAGPEGTPVWTNTFATAVGVDLGVDVAFHDPDDEEGSFDVAAETIPMLGEADLLFVQDNEARENLDRLGELPTWRALPAVANDRVVLLDPAMEGFALAATALVRVFGEGLQMLRET